LLSEEELMAIEEAVGKKNGSRRGKLHHLEVRKADNGHVVEHFHEHGPGGLGFGPPKVHVFGEGEGDEMLNHIAQALAVKRGGGGASGESEEDEEE
jgi:hypothetical protein